MVLENVETSRTCKFFGGASKLTFLVLSYHFGLGLQDGDCSIGVCFLGDGTRGHYYTCPTYKLPIANNMSFSNVELESGCWLDSPTSNCVEGGLSRLIGLA